MEKGFANSHKHQSQLPENVHGRGARGVSPSEGVPFHQVVVSSSYSSSQAADEVRSLVCCVTQPQAKLMQPAFQGTGHSHKGTWCHSLFINVILVFAGNIYPLQLLFIFIYIHIMILHT